MFECHITIVEDGATTRETMKQVVKEAGWTFSAIDGDPALGKGVYCYATKWFKDYHAVDRVIGELEATATYLARRGLKVKRTKVEVIVYDVQHRGV